MRIKSFYPIIALLITLVSTSVLIPQTASAQQASVSFQIFYDELSPYGDWVNFPNYGYVWVPSVGMDFAPYSSRGHWVLTEYGWTWISDYPWGWATFHYGRWFHDSYYGWLWVPDNEWGPSWVTWRRANGYYGWAPMGPNISISISLGGGYSSHNDHWIFVRDRDFGRPDMHRHYVNRSNYGRIIGNSIVINNTYIDNSRHVTYISGPTPNEVRKATGRAHQSLSIQEHSTPGQHYDNSSLRIYKPKIDKSSGQERQPKPPRVSNLKDVKQPSERQQGEPQHRKNPSKSETQEKHPSKANPTIKGKKNQSQSSKEEKGRKR